jgi:hypothetical protein
VKSDNGKTPLEALRELQRDPVYRAGVAESNRRMADQAEKTFWILFPAMMLVWAILAYFFGRSCWNLIQNLGDFEAPGSIGFVALTLITAVTTRKAVGL